ncbi:MAG: DNA methyltransferase [Anaerolinea sp.]|nr:DNA methyltransferase [Anaerolinea sp.]
MPRSAKSEVEAYDYIRRQLRELQWRVRNPSLGTGGQVWTQNQCFSHPEIKAALGLLRPENIVKLTERYLWIIEAKAERRQLAAAVDEAVNLYSKPINDLKGSVEALLATGIAGDEEAGYIARTMIRTKGKWRVVTINGQEATGLLAPDDVRALIDSGESDIHEFAPPQWLFLQAAERINGILHVGGINKNDRAKTMAALLLSVVNEPPNLDTMLPVLIGEINARSSAILRENGKPDFARFVEILPPTNTTNHVKFRAALVHTIQELLNLNIRSAMNSSTDVLGQFYEVFLKYGNGAKEIGIVLTPRHITRFAVEATGLSPADLVLDPACGTGGFLVAAFDHIRRTSTKRQVERFKQHNLFGIEQESYVAVLAIVNMIFRGDGKHNIVEGNCFTTNLRPQTVDGASSAVFDKDPARPGTEPITRVLMNPPFALKGEVDQERRFVSRALTLMADGGILFSLLPMDCMFGAHEDRVWRTTELLAHHTLLAVVSFPDELFYPAALKQVIGIIVRKGFPHPKEQPVFWARIDEDGHIKVKSKRIAAADLVPPRTAPDDIPRVLPLLRSFIANPDTVAVNEPMLCKTAPIDFNDPLLELLPEAYLDSTPPTQAELEAAVDVMARETAAFLIRFGQEARAGEFS